MNSKVKIEKQTKVKAPKRTRKFQHGDHIPRSEYNDGVLRNNHRATNRLSHEMQMYEKAHRVIMKDIGKESQMLRARMSASLLVSPRFDSLELSPNFKMSNPFTITSGTPFVRMDARNSVLKPIVPLSRNTQKKISLTDARRKANNNDAPVKQTQISKMGNSPQNEGKKKQDGEEKRSQSKSERSGSVLNNNNNSRMTLRSESEMSIIAIVNETNRDDRNSIADGRNSKQEGRVSKLSEVRGPSRVSMKSSHTSFIDILKEVEERKQREKEKELKLNSLPVVDNIRPKTPKPMTDYDDPADEEVFQKNVNGNTGLLKTTPNETFFNISS